MFFFRAAKRRSVLILQRKVLRHKNDSRTTCIPTYDTKSGERVEMSTATQSSNAPGKVPYCLFYHRFGKCHRGSACPFEHNPDRVAICTRWVSFTYWIAHVAFCNLSCCFIHIFDKIPFHCVCMTAPFLQVSSWSVPRGRLPVRAHFGQGPHARVFPLPTGRPLHPRAVPLPACQSQQECSNLQWFSPWPLRQKGTGEKFLVKRVVSLSKLLNLAYYVKLTCEFLIHCVIYLLTAAPV